MHCLTAAALSARSCLSGGDRVAPSVLEQQQTEEFAHRFLLKKEAAELEGVLSQRESGRPGEAYRSIRHFNCGGVCQSFRSATEVSFVGIAAAAGGLFESDTPDYSQASRNSVAKTMIHASCVDSVTSGRMVRD